MAQRDFEYPRTGREPDLDRTYVADSQNRAIVYIVIALVVLGIAFFATRAFDADYTLTNKTRFDAVLAWDVLNTLRSTGKF